MINNQDKQQNQAQKLDICAAKKAYASPVLREYGNMEELTQGTGLVLLDVLVQGSLTVSATTTP